MVNILLYCQECGGSFEGTYDKIGKNVSKYLLQHLCSKNAFLCKKIIKQKDSQKTLLQGKEKKLILIFLHQQKRKNYHQKNKKKKTKNKINDGK